MRYLTIILIAGTLMASELVTKAVKPDAIKGTPHSWNNSAPTIWSITGTSADTSLINTIETGNITFEILMTNSVNDSSQMKLFVYTSGRRGGLGDLTFNDFVLQDSTTFGDITKSEVKKDWTYTSSGSNRPTVPFYMIVLKGTVNNRKLGAVTAELDVSYPSKF